MDFFFIYFLLSFILKSMTLLRGGNVVWNLIYCIEVTIYVPIYLFTSLVW
jgi:hypothetical protein